MRWYYRNCIILYLSGLPLQKTVYCIVYTTDCFALQFIVKLLYSFVLFGFGKCVHFVSYTLNNAWLFDPKFG